MKRMTWTCFGIWAILSAMPGMARAQAVHNQGPDWDATVAKGAQAVLETADEVEYGSGRKSQIVKTELQVFDTPKGEPRKQQFIMYELGKERLLKFNAPADVAGTGILIKDQSTMYIYMPQYDRVRLVGSSNRKQTFMGSDFSFDDMAVSKLAPQYNAKLVETKADGIVLDLTAKPGADVAYPKMRVTIAKPQFYLARTEFFDETGRNVRTRLRAEPKNFNGWVSCTVHDIIDHLKNDHRSRIILQDIQVNSDEIKPDMFSKRSLVRGL